MKKEGKVKGKYNMWNESRMKGALQEYRELERAGNRPKLRYLARAWNVPKSTLQRRVKGVIEGHKHVAGRKPVLSEQEEANLADIIENLARRGFPMRKPEIH